MNGREALAEFEELAHKDYVSVQTFTHMQIQLIWKGICDEIEAAFQRGKKKGEARRIHDER